MNSKWWIGQDKEESGDNPADVKSWYFSLRTGDHHYIEIRDGHLANASP